MSNRPSPATQALWTERVRAWRESGQSAPAFAAGRGFEASTLRYWSSRLRHLTPPRFVPLIRTARAVEPAPAEFLVEVGSARVRVTSGFDATLLADVVRALGGVR